MNWGKAGDSIWVNPPYGRSIGQWIDKAIEQSALGRTVVMLTMACTDTRWWETAWDHTHEIRFISGRLAFLDHEGNASNSAPKGSALLVFRPGSRRFPVPICYLVSKCGS